MANWRTGELDSIDLSGLSVVDSVGSRSAPASGSISGILNIDKPAGITSHDVVDRIRKLAGQRRVGHAGTLDPMATGVLIICLGQATRMAEYLTRHDKSYRAVARLGQSTDTYDAEGKLLHEFQGSLPDRATVETALTQFRGEITQVPPIYSAIKVDGQPLYKRARRGEKLNPAPRKVTICRLELVIWDPPAVTLDVDCSAGTYIRSLAHDLGEALGCGAHLSSLVRLQSGHFRLEDASALSDLEGEAEGFGWRRHLLPLDMALADVDALELSDSEASQIGYGQAVEGPPSRQNDIARAYSTQGDFLAVVEYDSDDRLWHPRKVFVTS